MESILRWITSSDDLFLWSAQREYPLTDTSIFDEWHSDSEVAPHVLMIEDELVAYGEIWLDEAERSAELGRLIVSPQHRRQGLGRLLIEGLTSIAQELIHLATHGVYHRAQLVFILRRGSCSVLQAGREDDASDAQP